MTSALEFQSVSKSFNKGKKRVEALKDVSFSINEGEVFGFIGPNGAGKSTTIKIMLDIINDYHGDVFIYGKHARDANARRDVAYVPESPSVYEQFTPMEILNTAIRMYDTKQPNPDAWCMKWLERFSVEHVANKRMRSLSKGTVQRVALAHALVASPKLLVLDEPLSGLDPVGRKDVIDILSEYKREGGAIFFTSHVLYDVERIADRFGFIHKGNLATTRSPKELVSEHADRFIIRYHSENGPMPGGVSLRENEFEQEVSQPEMPDWIGRLNAKPGKIIDIKPAVSLEKVFFQFINEKQEVHNP